MIWNERACATLAKLWPKLSASQIGAQLRCSRNAVIGKAHRLGLPAKAPPEKMRSPEIAAMYAAGVPIADIAQKTGIAEGSISRALDLAGIARPRKRRRPSALKSPR